MAYKRNVKRCNLFQRRRLKYVLLFLPTIKHIPFRYFTLLNFINSMDDSNIGQLHNNPYEYILGGSAIILESLMNNNCIRLLEQMESIFNKSHVHYKHAHIEGSDSFLFDIFSQYTLSLKVRQKLIKQNNINGTIEYVIKTFNKYRKLYENTTEVPTLTISTKAQKTTNKLLSYEWNQTDTEVDIFYKFSNINVAPIHYIVTLSYLISAANPSFGSLMIYINHNINKFIDAMNDDVFKTGVFESSDIDRLDKLFNLETHSVTLGYK